MSLGGIVALRWSERLIVSDLLEFLGAWATGLHPLWHPGAEGVELGILVAPVRVEADGERLEGLWCTRMELGEPDASGRRRPVPVAGSEYELKADVVVPAIGQSPQTAKLADSGIKTTKRGTVEVDPVTLETSREGVFAGGDIVTGSATVISAMGAGRAAARAMHAWLSGELKIW